jgi:hypothetical protein
MAASSAVDRPWAHLKGYCVSNQDKFGATNAIAAIEKLLVLYATRKAELRDLLVALESLASRRNERNAVKCRSATLLSHVIHSVLSNLESRIAVSAGCGVICNVLASNPSTISDTSSSNSSGGDGDGDGGVSELFGSERVCDALVAALQR